MQIFLAEAENKLRAEVAATLRQDGHAVVECADGATLFVELENRLSRPAARRSVVIAQDQDQTTLRDLAERAGASAVLLKPIQMDELRRAVMTVIETAPNVPALRRGDQFR